MEPTQYIKKRTDFPVGMTKFIVENLPIHVTTQTVRNILNGKVSGIKHNKTYNYHKQITKLRDKYIKKIKIEQEERQKQETARLAKFEGKNIIQHGFIKELTKLCNCDRQTVRNAIYNNTTGKKAEFVREIYKTKYVAV